MRPAPTGPDRERRRERERARRRRARLRNAILVLLLAGLLVAAYALGHSAGGSSDEQPVVIDCVQRVATLDKWPPEGWEKDAVIAGPVAFAGAHDAAREETKNGSVTTELPVLVDAERQATITSSSDDVKLGFGEDAAPARSVTLKACPSYYHEFGTNRKVGPFTQFVGQFHAPEPTCVELDVRVLGEDETRHAKFGLGKQCD